MKAASRAPSAVVGNDAELSAKATEYENNYVAGIISQADECIAVKQFDAAKEILNAAQTTFPDNVALKDAQQRLAASIERAKNACKYLGKDITAYNNGLYYEEYNGTSSFNLAGVAYKRGFITKEQLLKLAEPLLKTDYGKYLVEVANGL